METFIIMAIVMIGGAVVLGILAGLVIWKLFTRPLLDEYDERKGLREREAEDRQALVEQVRSWRENS